MAAVELRGRDLIVNLTVPSPELRRISGSLTGHQTPQKSTSKLSTKPGQLQMCLELGRIASSGNAELKAQVLVGDTLA
jgi:hypothetical protein